MASDLVLPCLPMSHKMVTRLIWVNLNRHLRLYYMCAISEDLRDVDVRLNLRWPFVRYLQEFHGLVEILKWVNDSLTSLMRH